MAIASAWWYFIPIVKNISNFSISLLIIALISFVFERLSPKEKYEYASIKSEILKFHPEGWFNTIKIPIVSIALVVASKRPENIFGQYEANIYCVNGKNYRFLVNKNIIESFVVFFEVNSIEIRSFVKVT